MQQVCGYAAVMKARWISDNGKCNVMSPGCKFDQMSDVEMTVGNVNLSLRLLCDHSERNEHAATAMNVYNINTLAK